MHRNLNQTRKRWMNYFCVLPAFALASLALADDTTAQATAAVTAPEISVATLACNAQWNEACEDRKIVTVPAGHKLCSHEITVTRQEGDSSYQDEGASNNTVTVHFSAKGNLKRLDQKGAAIELKVSMHGVRENENCDGTPASPAVATPAATNQPGTAIVATPTPITQNEAEHKEPEHKEADQAEAHYVFGPRKEKKEQFNNPELKGGAKPHACACSTWIDAIKVNNCLVVGHGRDNVDCSTFQASITCVNTRDDCRALWKEFCPEIAGLDQTASKKRIFVENSAYCVKK